MRAAVMSWVEPGSTSLTHTGSSGGVGEHLDVAAAVLLVLAGVPDIVAARRRGSRSGGRDQGAVQAHERLPLPPRWGEDVAQVGCVRGDDVDGLVQIPVAVAMLTPASRASSRMSVLSLNQRSVMTACTNGVAARCQGARSWALR